MIEDIVYYPGYNALFLRIAYNTFHGVRFTGGRLTVGKDGTVVSCQDVGYDAFRRFIIYFFLSSIRFEYFVE